MSSAGFLCLDRAALADVLERVGAADAGYAALLAAGADRSGRIRGNVADVAEMLRTTPRYCARCSPASRPPA